MVRDIEVAVVARSEEKSETGGGHNGLVGKSDIEDSKLFVVVVKIAGILYFVAKEVDDDDAEATSEESLTIGKRDIIDSLIARDSSSAFDVGDIEDRRARDDVDVGIIICDEKRSGRSIVSDGGDASIGETRSAGERGDGSRGHIERKDRTTGGGIDMVGTHSKMIGGVKRMMRAPCADRDLSRERQTETEEREKEKFFHNRRKKAKEKTIIERGKRKPSIVGIRTMEEDKLIDQDEEDCDGRADGDSEEQPPKSHAFKLFDGEKREIE